MFTTDFTRAPKVAQGNHMFFGGTQYKGMRAMLQLAFVWLRVSRRMRSMPGYAGHLIWYRFPFTFGNVSMWDTREHMMAFAQSREHRDAVDWLTRPGVARAAFIRFLRADAHGHSLGEWRAEQDDDEWRYARYPFSAPDEMGDHANG